MEFETKLMKKYPELFHKDKYGNPIQSYCGISCPDGWIPLVDKLCNDIVLCCKENNITFIIDKIKEKFGELRFYYSGGNEEIEKLINKAEKESLTICQNTGNLGKIRTDISWWRVLCDEEYMKIKNNNLK